MEFANYKLMKKLIIIGVIIVALGGIIAFQNIKRNKNISENGFSFSYPAALIIEHVYSEGANYSGYNITNPKQDKMLETSRITVSIPLADAGGTAPFSEQIKNNPSYPPTIHPVVINDHKGEYIIMRGDTDPRNVPPIHNQTISMQLFTRYKTSPVLLTYFRYDSDSSLDQAWGIIKDTLKY